MPRLWSSRRVAAGLLATSAAAVATALMLLAALPPTAPAFQIKPNPNAKLDGKTVLAPAAERVQTTKPDGGQPIGPGMTVRRMLILQNRSPKTTGFDLDVAQVVGARAEDVVEVRHGVRLGAAAWVTLERTTVKLKQGETAFIVVTIKIPRAIKPGSKPFAVTATQRAATFETQGAGVNPIFRQVAIYIVDLPGDAPIKGKITRAEVTSASDTLKSVGKRRPRKFFFGTHRLTLAVEYRNDGERLLTPQGRVEVRDIFNRVAARYQIKSFSVYPEGGENAVTVDLRKLPALGLYRARLTLESDAGKGVRKLGWWLLMPTWVAIAFGVLVLLGVFWTLRAVLAQRRYARWEEEQAAGSTGGGGGGDGDGDGDGDEDDEDPGDDNAFNAVDRELADFDGEDDAGYDAEDEDEPAGA